MIDPERWPRLKELFFAALQRPPEDRAAALAELSAGDPDLAAELAALLAAHVEDDPLDDAVRELRDAALAAAEVGTPGARFGPWEILAPLGEGGMGVVFAARRADGEFDQRVALKVLREPFPDSRSIERFRVERQLLARLEHPGIARLIDGGTTANGYPYLVLEAVDGRPIDVWCDERRLPVRERIELFLRVAAAVEHAHRALVVHRDLKPSNILVTPAGEVKLLDFGIGRLLDGSVPGRTTGTLGRFLTPEYASPEQVRGEALTTATDVYSLGVLLYRLLVGAPPYVLTSARPTEVERVVCETAPTRPSEAAAGSRGARDLRGDLDTILLHSLRKEPERRYASVAAFAADLRRHLAGLPVAARGDGFGYRSGRFLRRHWLGVAASAAVASSVLVGAGLAWNQAQRATRERDAAHAAADRAERLNELLTSMLGSADPMRGDGRAVTVVEVLERASAGLGRQLIGQPALEADLRTTLASTYRNLGLPREAEVEHRRALLLAGGDRALEGRLRAGLAIDLRDQGRLAEAESELRAALPLLEGGDAGPWAMALDGLGVVLRHQGRTGEAIAAGRRAVELLRPGSPDPVDLANTVNDLALALGEHGDLAEAESLHREAVELVRSSPGAGSPLLAMTLANLGGILDLQGRFAEAAPCYREALEIQERELGPRHPDTLRTLTSFANLLWLEGRSDEAEPLARRAAELAVETFGPDHPLSSYARNILGGALLDLGRAAEAEPLLRAALESRSRQLGPAHWLTASARSNLGAGLAALGRPEEARRELEHAYRDLLADRGAEHEKTRLTRDRLARLDGPG